MFDGEESYAYSYGVVSAKYAKLFDDKTMENFIMAKNISEIVASLEGTEYEPEIIAIGKEIKLGKIEVALRKNFIRIYKEIVSTIPKGDRKALDNIIIEEINARNLRKILRGLQAKLEAEKIKELLEPFAGFDTEFLTELVVSKNIEEFISKLRGTKYYNALAKKFEEYKKSGNLLPLENALDKKLIDVWLDTSKHCSQEIKKFIKLRIDETNIKIILRCKLAGLACKEYITWDGFYLGKRELEKMIICEFKGILEILTTTPYGKIARDFIKEYEKTKSLVELEILLERSTLGILKESYIFNPLSIGSIIFFIDAKKREMKNLRRIIICKTHDISQKEIKALLI